MSNIAKLPRLSPVAVGEATTEDEEANVDTAEDVEEEDEETVLGLSQVTTSCWASLSLMTAY